MIRKILIALFSAVTVTGGHHINRRLDRVLLFFALLLLVFIVWLVVIVVQIYSGGWSLSDNLSSQVIFVSAFAVCLASGIVAFRDASDSALEKPDISTSGYVGGLLAIVASCVLIFPLFGLATLLAVNQPYNAFSTTFPTDLDGEGYNYYDFPRYPLFDSFRYGKYKQLDDLPEPPSGDHWLTGRIAYAGAPASGVKLELELNDAYITEQLYSDANGLFSVPVPAGDYELGALRIKGWEDQPDDGRFMVLDGFSPQRDEPLRFPERDVRTLTATASQDTTLIELDIVESIAMEWPTETGYDETPPSANSSDTISWQAVEGAASYVVEIYEVERRGDTTRYSPVTRTVIAGAPEISIASYPLREQTGKHEFAVTVAAYDANNNLVTASPDFFSNSFVLTDIAIAEGRHGNIVDLLPQATDEQREQSEKISNSLDFALRLIERGSLDEADFVLDRIEGVARVSQVTAVQGYVAAKRGDCEAANALFDTVYKELGQDLGDALIPDCYYADCPTPD